jgi:SAM-dependent methyltransferase
MRESATPHPAVQPLAGTAEATGLADQCVDIVTCCQSFHWFQPDAALSEFHRILKPGGRVALLWNDRDLDDPVTHTYSEILRQVSDPRFFERRDRKSAAALEASSLFTHYRALTFRHHHPLTLKGLLGLAQSSSYVSTDPDAIATLTQQLQTLASATKTVTLTYKTLVYLAEAVRS